MKNPIYQNESEMRKNWPMMANHLVTIARLTPDGIYEAQTGGKTYQWRASV